LIKKAPEFLEKFESLKKKSNLPVQQITNQKLPA